MPKAKLTNTFVNKAKCPKDKTKIVYFDTTDTGFILEVRSTGTKTFTTDTIAMEQPTKRNYLVLIHYQPTKLVH